MPYVPVSWRMRAYNGYESKNMGWFLCLKWACGAGIRNYIIKTLWGVITYPCLDSCFWHTNHVYSHQGFMSSWLKSCENIFCDNFNSHAPIRSQFCTCHDSLAVVACAKLEPGGWFNIKMPSYQYRKSHHGDKTILPVLSPQWDFLYW